MSGLVTLVMYLIILAVVAAVAYFVIKKAVKDALSEYDREKKN